jgi:hypothetical protein
VVPEELQLVQLASATGRPIGGREGSPARGPGQAYRWRYDFLIIKVRFEEKYLRASPPQRSEQQAAVRCASWHAYINVTQCRDRWIRGRVTWKKQYPDAAQPQRNARDTAEKVERQVGETGRRDGSCERSRESLRACRLRGNVQSRRATNLGCRAGLSSVPLPHPPPASAFSVRGLPSPRTLCARGVPPLVSSG